MEPDRTLSGESNVTTDHETIRAWVEERGGTPARRTDVPGDDMSTLYIVREDEDDADFRELSWDEFFETFDESDLAFVYRDEVDEHGQEQWVYEFVHRDDVLERVALDDESVRESLLAGETVRTEITETHVVERTIVETDTIESEVVDTEEHSRHLVESEVTGRELVEVDLLDEPFDPSIAEIELQIDETRLDTYELLEGMRIESRVVDRELVETDELEREDIEGHFDVDAVNRSILESDIVGSAYDESETIDTDVVTTELGEGGVVETELIERRLLEEEVVERKRLTYDLVDSEVLDREAVSSRVVQSELVDDEYLEERRAETAAEREAAAAGDAVTPGEAAAGEAAPSRGETSTVEEGVDAPGTAGEPGEPLAEEKAAEAVTITDDEIGKEVVDATGETVGMVTQVEQGTAFIDPHPSLTDRIKAALDWGDVDEDAYPLDETTVKRVTDDRIELVSIEREP